MGQEEGQQGKSEKIIRGIAVSPGTAIGPVFVSSRKFSVVPEVSIRPEDVEEEVENLCQLAEVPMMKLDIESNELGFLCRRQHFIQVLGLLKE